ncbi:MAG: MATE family efflux transporter [Opitutales bacterium]|nr:MATE family efflux transporter [Opitutales bacterium]
MASKDPLTPIREGLPLSRRQQLSLIVSMSVPCVLSMMSIFVMEAIDASMLGHLSTNASASVGLVATPTWFFFGMVSAASLGFNVQIAEMLGAKKNRLARGLFKMALLSTLVFALVLSAAGTAMAPFLPHWLGGNEAICGDASLYFSIFVLSVPFLQITSLATGTLQSSGNAVLAGGINIAMCALDVLFNYLFIFVFGWGVAGAAAGTAFSEFLAAGTSLFFIGWRLPALALRARERFLFEKRRLWRALKISFPVAVESLGMNSAYIAMIMIVAPLGTLAIASNSFGITIESFCFMPGYGIAQTATAIMGVCIGARRKDLARSLAWCSVGLGVAIMTVTGVVVYCFAPWLIAILSPDTEVQALGTAILRIEAFAEPLFAASIIAAGAMRGWGETLGPAAINFSTMWILRIPLALALVGEWGLKGVWTAMALELCVRGIAQLIKLTRSKKV